MSFMLFGVRGAGKSTLLRQLFSHQRVLTFDLLDPELEERFSLHPEQFREEILPRATELDWVVVDEIQKCPKLLNSVHKLIESHHLKFALTGSNARRLRQKGVNLLAGRALIHELFPLTSREMGIVFVLEEALMFGTLPAITRMADFEERNGFLRAYANTYLKYEVQAEQWVRNLDPFRRFLAAAAQMNGKIVNYSALAREAGTDANTIQNYFSILEDTLLAIRIEAFARSVRKQQIKAPKYYLCDLGVKRALDKTLEVKLVPGTSAYGEAFEHLVVLELYRNIRYFKPDWELSYLLTKDGAEIDLILSRPGLSTVLIEIKSKTLVDVHDARHLLHFQPDFPGCDLMLLSLQQTLRSIGDVRAIHWQEGIAELFK